MTIDGRAEESTVSRKSSGSSPLSESFSQKLSSLFDDVSTFRP
jgi:hypothetical protein